MIVALSPPELPRLNAIAFDPSAFLFASALIATMGYRRHAARSSHQPQ
jgi:hypothetical protein